MSDASSSRGAGVRRGVRELVVAALALVAVAFAVAAVVFGLIVVLYDHGGPVAHAAISAAVAHSR